MFPKKIYFPRFLWISVFPWYRERTQIVKLWVDRCRNLFAIFLATHKCSQKVICKFFYPFLQWRSSCIEYRLYSGRHILYNAQDQTNISILWTSSGTSYTFADFGLWEQVLHWRYNKKSNENLQWALYKIKDLRLIFSWVKFDKNTVNCLSPWILVPYEN